MSHNKGKGGRRSFYLARKEGALPRGLEDVAGDKDVTKWLTTGPQPDGLSRSQRRMLAKLGRKRKAKTPGTTPRG